MTQLRTVCFHGECCVCPLRSSAEHPEGGGCFTLMLARCSLPWLLQSCLFAPAQPSSSQVRSLILHRFSLSVSNCFPPGFKVALRRGSSVLAGLWLKLQRCCTQQSLIWFLLW